MPKKQHFESVVHAWLEDLSFQMQALLMTAMRGPDGCDKYNTAKAVVRYLRGVVLKPAGHWNGENNNDFMWGDYDDFAAVSKKFWDDHDGYPHHFIMHLVHCAEVVGYEHPDETIKLHWLKFYCAACDAFHMAPESREEMRDRLNDFGCGFDHLKEYTSADDLPF